MTRLRITSCLLLAAIGFGTTACDQFQQKQQQQGSITQHLMMVDNDGKNYGTIELDPINGGKIFDAQGRLIGRVVNPGTPPLAPSAQ